MVLSVRRYVVWIAYDWRLALVIDDQGRILDQEEWTGKMDQSRIIERLQLLGAGGLTAESRLLSERWPDACIHMAGDPELPDHEFPEMSAELLQALDEASLAMSQAGVDKAAGDPDRRLEHLLSATEELRAAWLTMESRLVEWTALFLPAARVERDRNRLAGIIAESDSLQDLATSLSSKLPEAGPSELEWKSLRSWAEVVRSCKSRLDRMEDAIRDLASEHLPSLSLLMGPLLAARLCASAHGRMRLARLPAGTVQILGAEKAFFSHLHNGTPPPKHGHIFMHPWISRSAWWIRGKISRMLAAKASLAARSDAFAGAVWNDEMLAEVEKRVEEIRSTHVNPPAGKRR